MRREAVVLLVSGCLVLAAAAPAWPLSQPHPQPAQTLSIRGFLKGRLGEDRDVRFAIVAAHSKGWFRMQSVTVSLTLHGQPIQDITYAVRDHTVTMGGRSPVLIAPGAPDVIGSFVGIAPSRSHFLTSVFSIRVELRVFATAEIPRESIFRLTVADDDGTLATAFRRPQLGRRFLSWGTLGLAAALALFVGGLAGSTFSSRRHRQAAPSVWDIVERRLKEQRARPPAVAPSAGGAPG